MLHRRPNRAVVHARPKVEVLPRAMFLSRFVAFDAFRARLVRFQKRLALWFAQVFDLQLRVDWVVDVPDVHLDLTASHVFFLSSSSSSSPSLCLSIFAFCVQKRKVDSRKFSADDGWGNEKRRERETKSIPLPIQEERAPANNNNTKRERMNAID